MGNDRINQNNDNINLKMWNKIVGTRYLKNGELFYTQYLNQIKHKSAGYMFDLKGWIHSSAWSPKHFCTISESRGISKTIWGIILQNLKSDTTLIHA